MRPDRICYIAACCVLFFASISHAQESDETGIPVGFPGTLEEVFLPGTLLRSKNIETRDQPLVLRITNQFATAEGYRYEFEYHGLEPGDYNLINYLERADGSEIGDLPDVMVKIFPILPPGQIEPNALEYQSSFFRSYYLPILVAGGAVWLAGLWMILFWGRGTFRRLDPGRHRITVAQRIRPLVEKAVNGELEATERGELERTLVSFWQRKLRLENAPPATMMAKLRNNPESGELFKQLENWLHRPDPQEGVDIAELMKPYQTMNIDEIE